ncbi:GGDEF domain-containing protein [Bradyrhizobium tropiciagri]|uniref:putative bifunctional diguanylate cyclase/phosphodiesterase n=1 Tax=Bradyrhizobium tropiciagri TaxID=312253 RepID=UPI001BADC209|nr:bifunctional diguanylate cyclase/phosphodiesterase [Bradyrhizobium tropiciagri]MBR0869366.1 GGDEF domain-containing protein [Bradyrhizobium tropiciagri]
MYSRLLDPVREAFCSPSPATRVLVLAAVSFGALGGTWLVYTDGGAQFATLQILYLPIILAGLVFGVIGGLVAGAASGLLLGPFMPLDVAHGEAQQLANWLLRAAFFCLVGGIVGIGASTLRRQLNRLDWLTEHDAGTGLLNQVGFARLQRQAIERDRAAVERLLVVAQIKNMLDIQNTFGARFAEKLLEQVYARARAIVPADLPIGLLQRDRLVAGFDGIAATRKLRGEIATRIRLPYRVDEVPVYVDFAFGAAAFPAHGRTFDELLQRAKIAMHAAATRNLPFVLYDTAADVSSRENLELLGMISAALANKEFAVWHQAKLHLATDKIAGTEALLRWRHPQRGFIPPGAFIPQAEETPLIDDVTKWVIGAALADLAAWRARGHSFGVAINLSVHNLHERSLLETLHETVTLHGIDPHQVELEITESAVMDDFDYCVVLMRRLRDLGYRVSIDDFGTGHSSLAYLKRLPVCALKIDQAFVRDLAIDESDQKIVRAVLELARSLNLDSVAEGVEDEAALALLREWGCDYAQGYAVHRPAPYNELLAWLEKPPLKQNLRLQRPQILT